MLVVVVTVVLNRVDNEYWSTPRAWRSTPCASQLIFV